MKIGFWERAFRDFDRGYEDGRKLAEAERHRMKPLQPRNKSENICASIEPQLTPDQQSLIDQYGLQIESILESSRFLYTSLGAVDITLKVKGTDLNDLREHVEECAKIIISLHDKIGGLQYALRANVASLLNKQP